VPPVRQVLNLSVLTAGLLAFGCDSKPPSPEPQKTGEPPAAVSPAAAEAPTPAPPEPPAPRSKRPERPLNVLLLTVDSLRADMPWTGYERPIAPNLTRLAKESVVYTHAYSMSSYTAQSVGTLLSGRYPSTLYRAGWFFTGYAKSNVFFTEALQEKGIRTIGWHGHMYFARGKGLEQGFDVWEMAPGITFDPNTDNHVTSEKLTKLGIELLGNPENTGKQFFAWVHYMDPHDVYVKHAEAPDFGNKNRDRYDSEVWFTDKWLGELIAFAEKQPWWKDTAVVVSADHGEAFGDHGMYKHAFELWEVLTRVPLIFKLPGAEPAQIDVRRSAIDLAPTIMDLMGQTPLDSFMGQSLAPELYGEKKAEPRDVIVTELAEDSHNPPRRAIIAGDWKLLVYGAGWKYMLFDLAKDPDEKQDLAKQEPEKLAEMKKLFNETFDKIPSVEPYGGMKLKGGKTANGPMGPPKGGGG
jgi:choline-sulfatase